ncbi:MAG: hypothetical protein LUH11_02960 [Candidatus Gastranaerophilales bacterium]|nr:hypothetical protein [Candidatus Gastranaerophilales bacterium]
MSIEQTIILTFEQCFKKYYYDELVVGKLAHSEFKTGVKKGDEVDVIMPASVALFDYTGGDLPDAEEVTNSTVKIRINKGKAFHFELDEVKQKVIENTKDIGQRVNLCKEYSYDAIKKFAACVDCSYAELYKRAGHYVDAGDDDNSAIELDENYAKEILNYMRVKFQRGDGKGHTNWIDGSMIAVVPPEYEFYLNKLEDYIYVESGHKKLEKGFIGKLGGWEILVSNNIKETDEGIFYPLFGIKGKTLAGGVSSNLNTKSYMPEKNFNTRYKGYGLYGVGAPRVDFLGTAKISAPLKLTAAA